MKGERRKEILNLELLYNLPLFMQHRILNKLYPYRFELFFISLMLFLFGSLLFPRDLFEELLFPMFIVLNIFSGLLMFMRNRNIVLFITVVFLLLIFLKITNSVSTADVTVIKYGRYILYAMFYALVSYDLIKQIWNADKVTGNIILGTMSGYICVGMLAYFAFMAIEIVHPGSFNGIPADLVFNEKSRQLMNFSFITMLTVGYGDISPATFAAQKLSVLTAMVGQFYLVIITAVVIGKFLLNKEK